MSVELVIDAIVEVDGTVTLAEVPPLTQPAKAVVTVTVDEGYPVLPPEELRFLQALKTRGVIREIKPRVPRGRDFRPIEVEGSPLSESIIADRD